MLTRTGITEKNKYTGPVLFSSQAAEADSLPLSEALHQVVLLWMKNVVIADSLLQTTPNFLFVVGPSENRSCSRQADDSYGQLTGKCFARGPTLW